MALTKEWFTTQKNNLKVKGKAAPVTKFEEKLIKYDAAMKALDKEKSYAKWDEAKHAFDKVKENRKTSAEELEGAGFKALADLLKPSLMEAEEKVLNKIKEEILLAQKMAKADTQQEAVYEALWDAYEKQQEKLRQGASKTLLASMLSSLEKLEAQADRAGQSSPHLLSKYNKLAQGLAKEKTQITQQNTAYLHALQQAIHARDAVLPGMQQLTVLLTNAKQQLTQLKTRALQAQQARNSFTMNNVRRDVGLAWTAQMQQQYDRVAATFSPDSAIRTSADVKAAGIASEDSQTLIRPSFDAINLQNKTNLQLKRDIEGLLAEIDGIKISAAAGQ